MLWCWLSSLSSLFGLQDDFHIVEFDTSNFGPNGDQVVFPADINRPDGPLLARLDDIDCRPFNEIKDNQLACIVTGQKEKTIFGELE